MSMALLAFLVPDVTITQAVSTFTGFYMVQLVYGAAMLFVVSLAKVYYAEYRHETIDEDLPTEHIVDQRPDFFYGIRASGRQGAQMLLGLLYLPLCIGVLHMLEEVRHEARRPRALPTCYMCNWCALSLIDLKMNTCHRPFRSSWNFLLNKGLELGGAGGMRG